MEILIVDDEVSAIEAVLKGVNWDNLLFSKIHTANSKQEAMKLLDCRNIDILLCDIEMPKGSGLELLEWINEHKSGICCIFMTCHADFGYAQRAMHLESFAYILKPLDFKELENRLQAAISKVQKGLKMQKNAEVWEDGKKVVQKQFWRELFIGDIGPGKERIRIYIERHNLDIPINGSFLPILISPGRYPENFAPEDKKLIYFALRNIIEELFVNVYTEREVEALAEGKVLVILTLKADMNEKELKKLVEECCLRVSKASEQYLLMPLHCQIGSNVSIEEIPEQIESFYEMDASENLTNEEKELVKISPVNKVIEYIIHHLEEELTVESLAQLVYLNPDYLNRIFKKEMGVSINKYTLQQKMDRAKWLLKNTHESIGEIASMVGYYNYSSFYRVFIKMIGQSPQEWKEENQN